MKQKHTPEEVEQMKETAKVMDRLADQGFCLNALIKNKYNLTEEEQLLLLDMSPKEKKAFLRGRNALGSN